MLSLRLRWPITESIIHSSWASSAIISWSISESSWLTRVIKPVSCSFKWNQKESPLAVQCLLFNFKRQKKNPWNQTESRFRGSMTTTPSFSRASALSVLLLLILLRCLPSDNNHIKMFIMQPNGALGQTVQHSSSFPLIWSCGQSPPVTPSVDNKSI